MTAKEKHSEFAFEISQPNDYNPETFQTVLDAFYEEAAQELEISQVIKDYFKDTLKDFSKFCFATPEELSQDLTLNKTLNLDGTELSDTVGAIGGAVVRSKFCTLPSCKNPCIWVQSGTKILAEQFAIKIQKYVPLANISVD